MEAIRAQLGVEKVTLFGISYGTELAIQYARTYPQHVERLILDSVVDPDDPDPYFTSTFRAMSPDAAVAVPGPLRAGSAPTPASDLGQLVAQLRAEADDGARLRRPRPLAQGHRSPPLDLFDLMLVTDYIPPLRAILPIAVRSALEGDGALLARMIRDSCALDVLGSPRDFSTARYATVCETEPMPWDPGTPIDQRPAVVQQRIAALPANTFAPFDPPVVVEDEIDLCLRWPDVPRPPSTAAPLPYPTVPTLILQGGEDLRTPPEVSARVAARIPGSIRIVVPGTGHSTVSDPRTCSRDGDRPLHRRQVARRSPRASGSRPASRRSWARRSPSSRCASRAACRARSGGPSARSARRSTTSGSSSRRPRSRPPAAACAAAPGRSAATAGPAPLRGGRRRDADRQRQRRITLRVAGAKAARGTVTLRSGGRLSGTLGGRRISLRLGAPDIAAAKASRALELAR